MRSLILPGLFCDKLEGWIKAGSQARIEDSFRDETIVPLIRLPPTRPSFSENLRYPVRRVGGSRSWRRSQRSRP